MRVDLAQRLQSLFLQEFECLDRSEFSRGHRSGALCFGFSSIRLRVLQEKVWKKNICVNLFVCVHIYVLDIW